MRFLLLILAWMTPALIAGALGWSGIWGTGSAAVEFLIPIPVAGGVLHVPSFLIAAAIILTRRDSSRPWVRYLPVIAFGVLVAALSMMLELDRLNAWLFTDFSPAGSPVRLRGNPLLLFIVTDAFWVGCYAAIRGFVSPARYWIVLPLIPLAVIGASALTYRTSGPVFEIGGSSYGRSRGEEIEMVYTSEAYDEDVFVDWLARDGSFARPWLNPNAEHVAVYFTNSMQAIKWRQFDQVDSDSTVATVCLYEEDLSMNPHRGYYDCFAERNTVEENLSALAANESTGLGTDIDQWLARALLCDDVEVPEETATDIALTSVCRGMVRGYPRDLRQFIERYGGTSEQVSFVRAEAAVRGMSEN